MKSTPRIFGRALFNPSIVPHPDQSDLPDGSFRFVLSLRATGEGHIKPHGPRHSRGASHVENIASQVPPKLFLT